MIVHGVEIVVDSRCSGVCLIEELWSCDQMVVSRQWLSWLQSYCICGDVIASIGGGREVLE